MQIIILIIILWNSRLRLKQKKKTKVLHYHLPYSHNSRVPRHGGHDQRANQPPRQSKRLYIYRQHVVETPTHRSRIKLEDQLLQQYIFIYVFPESPASVTSRVSGLFPWNL